MEVDNSREIGECLRTECRIVFYSNFGKIFVKSTLLLKASWFHAKSSKQKSEFILVCVCSHWKKISSNQLFSNFFSKTVTFTKVLLKICKWFHEKNRQIEKCKDYSLPQKKNFVKSTI